MPYPQWLARKHPPVAAQLVCPPANQTIEQDPAVFTWTQGSQTPNYRLLLGPAVGSSRDGDSSLITGLQGKLAGLPPGQNLFVTLWSYDQNGNAVQPPSSCPIKTPQQQAIVAFKDVPEYRFRWSIVRQLRGRGRRRGRQRPGPGSASLPGAM